MKNAQVIHVAVGVILDNEANVLIALRHDHVHQGGLWEFPGGKLEDGESVEKALIRELKEELDIVVLEMTPLIKVRHQYADLNVLLDVWTVLGFSGNVRGVEGQRVEWVSSERLSDYAFPEANYPIVSAVRLADEYAILNAKEETELADQFTFLLNSGVKLIQLRVKLLAEEAVIRFFKWAMPLCKNKAVLLMVNSSVQGINQIDAEGLHLTTADLLALNSRPEGYAWVAASCHNLLELQYAEAIGVDFVVIAPVQMTKTHPGTKPLGWEQFQQLIEKVNMPVFALGGLKKTDKVMAKEAGAQGIAGITAFLK